MKLLQRFSGKQRKLIIGSVVLGLLSSVIAVAGIGAYFLWDYYLNAVNFTVEVTDLESELPLKGAQVELDGITAKTDKTGRAVIGVRPEDMMLNVTANRYQDFSIELTRSQVKAGTYEVQMQRLGVDVTGVVIDAIDKQPVEGASVKADFEAIVLEDGSEANIAGVQDSADDDSADDSESGEEAVTEEGIDKETVEVTTVETNEAGEFTLLDLPKSRVTITVTMENYQDVQVEVDLSEVEGEPDPLDDIELSPSGRVIFSSDREGKSAIYTSTMDGEENKLLDNVDGTEDKGPVMSNDKRYVSFWSEDPQDKEEDGSSVWNPQIFDLVENKRYNLDNGGLISDFEWLPNSQGVIYRTVENKEYEDYRDTWITMWETSSKKASDLLYSKDLEGFFKREGNSVTSLSIEETDISPDSRYLVARVALRWEFGFGENMLDYESRLLLVDLSDKSKRELTIPSGGHASIYNIEFSSDSKNVEFRYYSDEIGTYVDKRIVIATGSVEDFEKPQSEDSVCAFYYSSQELASSNQGCCGGYLYYSYIFDGCPLSEETTLDGETKVYIESRDNKLDIFKKSGETETRLTKTGGVSSMMIHPSGRYVLYYQYETDPGIYAVGLDGGTEPVKVTEASMFAGVVE